jgi:hypothetical protein
VIRSRLLLAGNAVLRRWPTLGGWRSCADEFIGPDIDQAIAVLEAEQQVINERCVTLSRCFKLLGLFARWRR